MLRLPSFIYSAPATVGEVVKILADAPDALLIAGGTDVVPNMKRRQWTPKNVVGLKGVAELQQWHESEAGGPLVIGAGVTLTTIVNSRAIRESYRGLWQAAAQIATPHLRNMGTIGGNLCLDTRCTYYDQTEDWRKAIGYCMKKDGETCWVATSSKRCLAVSSTDTAPMLLALGATVTLASATGIREIAVEDLYNNDGMHYLTRRPDELLTSISVPDAGHDAASGGPSLRTSYWKLRRRGSFDFPVGAAAAAVSCDAAGVVRSARVALGAVASRPLLSEKAASVLIGHHLTDDVIAAAADAAYEIAKPMDNTDFELVWRKKMVKSLVTSALREVRGDDMRAKRLSIARQLL